VPQLVLDESRFPVIVVHVPARWVAADAEMLLTGSDRWLSQRLPYGLVFLIRRTRMPAISELKPILSWWRKNHTELEQWCRAVAFVTDSPVVRGVVRAVMALQPSAMSRLVTPSFDEGFAWTQEALRPRS